MKDKITYMQRMTMLCIGALVAVSFMFTTSSCNKSDDLEYEFDSLALKAKGKFLYSFFLREGEEIEKQYWKDGNLVGLYLTKDTLGNPYEDMPELYSNIRHQFLSGVWFSDPYDIPLTKNEAVLYAYYPFVPNANPFAIDVNVRKQVDYMYGTHMYPQKSVKSGNAVAYMDMKHVMAMLDFRFKKYDFKANVVVSDITIRKVKPTSASDTILAIPLAGKLNIQTGEVSYTEYGQMGYKDLFFQLKDEYTTANRFLCYAFPYDIQGDEIELVLGINGKNYSVTLDWQNDWNRGYRSVYNITFTGKNLYLENVSIDDWDNKYIDVIIRD